MQAPDLLRLVTLKDDKVEGRRDNQFGIFSDDYEEFKWRHGEGIWVHTLGPLNASFWVLWTPTGQEEPAQGKGTNREKKLQDLR